MRQMLLTAAFLATAGLTAPVAAQNEAETVVKDGVTLQRHITVDGHSMVLNGVALRKKFIIKVYVAGLYLTAKDTSDTSILSADSPRRLVMEFLRGVDKGKICGAWNDGLRDNTPDASEEVKAQFGTLCDYMADNIEKTERMVFTYIPGTGTTIEVKGEVKGTIPGKAFADALFRSWIGPKPGPGGGFKKDLLGLD